jgi:hypothetical protein
MKSSWFITINGHVVEAGKKGVIKSEVVAQRLYRTLEARYPNKEVILVEAMKVKK